MPNITRKHQPRETLYYFFTRMFLSPLQTSSVSEVDATPQKTDVPSSSPSAASEQDVSVHLILPLTFQLCAHFLSQ